MLRYLGMTSLIALLVGCASTADKAVTTAPVMDAETAKTQWDMTGRLPEWSISINGNRFHGSFPGRYEGRMITWAVIETQTETHLNSPDISASIVLVESECEVAGENYTHAATVNINKQTFKGCAKHKS